MTDQPTDRPQDPSGKQNLGDQIRAKLDEYQVEQRLEEISGTIEGAVRQGLARAGEIAHEHRDDLERLIDKAADAVDRRTDGKHAERISQVRGSLERGVGKIADQRAGGEVPPTDETPGDGVPPSNG